MFDALTGRLRSVFDGLLSRGILSEADVDKALADVRRALVEADVALPVARDLVEKVRERAVGQKALSSVRPGEQVVVIVQEALTEALGETVEPTLRGRPAVVLLVGLQGSGKTTTAAKLGRWHAANGKRSVMLASLDTRRPAAMEQLAMLGERAGLDVLERKEGEAPTAIAKRALETARGKYDLLLLDTAGRMAVDEDLMAECVAIRDAARPGDIWLVADSLTGQSAVEVAQGFHEALGLTGVVLTRLDGDGRGGAALSMRSVIGQPILYAGVGEGIDELEIFHPDRVASRIVGMGDIETLAEKVAEELSEEEAKSQLDKMVSGKMTLVDYSEQIRQIRRIGGAGKVLGMLPGMSALKQEGDAQKEIERHLVIIQSMTPEERKNPGLINGSRRHRIAKGAGVKAENVNNLLKALGQMQSAAKMMGNFADGAAAGGQLPDMRQMAQLAQQQAARRPAGKKKGKRTRRW